MACLLDGLREFRGLPSVVAEGPAGFARAALLRAGGFSGGITVLPYLNPRRWFDVAAVAVYRRFAAPEDRVFLGSAPSAALYRALGVDVVVGEPYGIDDRVFRPRPDAERTRRRLGIPPGRLLLFSGRAQPDKDIYPLLRAALKARVLFGDLQIVLASHVVDDGYLAAAREQLDGDPGVHFVFDPPPQRLAALYAAADVFVTASTSHFETFGRAPAEALACGTPVVAPRYDGFAEVLDQPGGTLVDVRQDGVPEVDEERLLRGVYDVLSSPCPPRREDVSAIALRRFGRSRSIRQLSYVAGGPRPGPSPVPPARLDLPAAWRAALAEIAHTDPMDALARFCDGRDAERLAEHDDAFAIDVRRTLCPMWPDGSRLDRGERVSTCR
jgi:glycosyltransferase involved in cell wall biosynthesis